METPSATFCNVKYFDFFYIQFLAYYTLETKSKKTSENQPCELNDHLIENDHANRSFPQKD